MLVYKNWRFTGKSDFNKKNLRLINKLGHGKTNGTIYQSMIFENLSAKLKLALPLPFIPLSPKNFAKAKVRSSLNIVQILKMHQRFQMQT